MCIRQTTLRLLFDEKDTIIKNLIIFNDGIEKKLYTNSGNFAAVYPFVPYQFNLLASVLTSIRTHGASGKHLAEGERSMLALFKESAVKIMEQTEGSIVAFNMFYDALEQFLDHSHKGVISRASDNEYLNPDKTHDCFDVSVLKTLFMVKYVKEVVANIDNLTSLMVTSIDEDRIALKTKVEDALKRLERQTLIQKHGDRYVFLTDEEQEINREIENQNVELSEILNKISEMIFDGIYDEKKYRNPAFNGRYTFGFSQIVDDRPYKANQNFDISLKILTPNYEMGTDETTIRMMSGQSKSVILALPNDKAFIDEIRSALKIERYIRLNTTNVITKYEQIKDGKRTEMRERLSNAKMFLEQSLKNADIYVGGDKLQISAKEISNRINDAMSRLVNATYHKLSYINKPMGESDIKAVLKGKIDGQISLESANSVPNKLALHDVLDFISMNSQRHTKTSLKSIMERFTKAPYGFIEDDVQYLVAKLFKDGDLSFYLNNDIVTLITKSQDEIYKYISRKDYLEKLLTEKREKANDKQKKAVREVMKELFNTTIASDDDDTILINFKKYASNLKEELDKLDIRYENNPKYPGKTVVKNGKTILLDILSINNSAEFFKSVDKAQDEMMDFAEDFEPVKTFFNGDQKTIWDKSIKLLQIYEESKTFIVDKKIEEVVAQIKQIMEKAVPYQDIRKIPELLDKYTDLYGSLLEEIEKPVFLAIDESKSRVLDELNDEELKNTFLTVVNSKFSALNEKAKDCNNVATLQNIKVEADALKVRLLNEIQDENERIKAKNLSEQIRTEVVTDSGKTNPVPYTINKKAKKQQTLSIKSINSETTWRVETEADIDKYIEKLRTKLKQELKDDLILNIEF